MNEYLLILGGIFVVIVSADIAYGYTAQDCADEWFSDIKAHCFIPLIFNNQLEIIDKLDWNNCVISHKATWGYLYDSQPKAFEVYNGKDNTYTELVKSCGEMP